MRLLHALLVGCAPGMQASLRAFESAARWWLRFSCGALLAVGLMQCHPRGSRQDPQAVGDSSPEGATIDSVKPPAERAQEGPAGYLDDNGVSRAAGPPRRPGEWIGTRPDTPGLELGDFAVLAPSSAEHPQGVIAALGRTKAELFAVRVDVATGHELGRQGLDSYDYGFIAVAGGSIVLGTKTDQGLELAWLDEDAARPRRRRLLAGIGAGLHDRLREFVGFDDRLVVVSGGYRGQTTIRLFDGGGALLSAYRCRVGLSDTSPAILERLADQVVLTGLTADGDRQPICAGHLHGQPRWQEARLPRDELYARDGKIYLQVPEHAWRELGEDLQPHGPDVVPEPSSPWLTGPWPCWGLTGTVPWKQAVIRAYPVVDVLACCGDSGGGLFICRPPDDSDAGPYVSAGPAR